MKKTHKAFTLVEVLIVVIIIAVLAALVLPRMAAQTKKAELAEPLQMMGALKRASLRYFSFAGVPSIAIDTPYSNPCPGWESGGGGLTWSALGLQDLNQASAKWHYWVNMYTTGALTIETVRVAGCDPDITVNIAADGRETWVCPANMTILYDLNDATKQIGCKY